MHRRIHSHPLARPAGRPDSTLALCRRHRSHRCGVCCNATYGGMVSIAPRTLSPRSHPGERRKLTNALISLIFHDKSKSCKIPVAVKLRIQHPVVPSPPPRASLSLALRLRSRKPITVTATAYNQRVNHPSAPSSPTGPSTGEVRPNVGMRLRIRAEPARASPGNAITSRLVLQAA
jgi:hypothetical protein